MKRETQISGSYVTKFGKLLMSAVPINWDYLQRIYSAEELNFYLKSLKKK
jgi:hypothetical protein